MSGEAVRALPDRGGDDIGWIGTQQTRLDASIGDPRRIEKVLNVAVETFRLKVLASSSMRIWH
jgi:hypothetical protein